MELCCSPRFAIVILVAMEIAFLLFTLSLSVDRGRLQNFMSTTPAPSDVSTVDYDNDTADAFLTNYSTYCEKFLVPHADNIKHYSKEIPLCPCIPNDLVGRINVSAMEPLSIGQLELQHTELAAGGSWEPTQCIARHRVAIIVPFRRREEHLQAFLNLVHPMLQRQLLQYTIFVAEQAAPAVFNKASLMNAAFMIARDYAHFDCYVFHDVDMLPEDDRNFYTCSRVPRHVGSHISKWKYQLPYEGIFGGVTAFKRQHFEFVNGFSNQFYGWGGEDDDMYNRILAKRLRITRFSRSVARYTMIKHRSDVGNPNSPVRGRAFKYQPKIYPLDGLNTVRYKLLAHEARPLYTWLHLVLPPHPSYFRGAFRAPLSEAHRYQTCVKLMTFFVFLSTAFINI